MTVVFATAGYFIIPDWPHTAKFLDEAERSMLSRRLALDVERASMNHWDKYTAKRIFGDVKIYLWYVSPSIGRCDIADG